MTMMMTMMKLHVQEERNMDDETDALVELV